MKIMMVLQNSHVTIWVSITNGLRPLVRISVWLFLICETVLGASHLPENRKKS